AALEEVLEQLRAEGADGVLEDLIDDEPRQRWISAVVSALGAEGRVWRGELPLNVGGGRTVPVSALGVVHRDDDGDFDWIAMLARDISELRHLATHDVLTGLPNRSLFVDELEAAVARHARARRGVAVLFCDLDGFKAINDDHGHAAGDAVLVEVAQRLRTCTGSVDGAARVGGDEFVLVCEGLTDTDELGDLAEMIIARVTQPVRVGDDAEVKVGISVGIGVARNRQATVDPDQLLTLADTAMYRAKSRGGNRYRIAALDD
ncbi:MAG: GGDEF domain-containing protein, partial [Acidimicrobiales bacterium]